MLPKLGVLAGGGELPKKLFERCGKEQRPFFAIAFEGSTSPETVENVPHEWFRLGAVGGVIKALKRENVQDLVLIGNISRPSWKEVRPDFRGMTMLPKLLAAGQGDNSILTVAMAELEAEGFNIVGIHNLLTDLIAPEGNIGRLRPDQNAASDIQRGIEVIEAMGKVDVGQATIVQQGIILGVEAVEGTDALIKRCGSLHRGGDGGVLVKRRKPEQDDRADLPTIGLRTVELAAESGLQGIAVEAGATLLVDRTAMTELADRTGLFLFGFSLTSPQQE